METILDKLREQLDKFWMWYEQTPYEYSIQRRKQIYEEWEYLGWDILTVLANDAIEVIATGERNKELIDCILEVMALDNERERILNEE